MKYSKSNTITYEINTGDEKTYNSITNTREIDIGMIILIVVLSVLAYEIAHNHTFLVVPQYIWVLSAIFICVYIILAVLEIIFFTSLKKEVIK